MKRVRSRRTERWPNGGGGVGEVEGWWAVKGSKEASVVSTAAVSHTPAAA